MGKAALIVVDVQRDFCEGGALAAEDTLSLLKPLYDCIERARRAGVLVVYTRDWHPADHSSFKENGGVWPVHSVAKSEGAELMPPLRVTEREVMIHKGVDAQGAGYSGFEATDLGAQLKERKIRRIGITGIATEYCVRATALDGLAEGFETTVLTDLVRAVRREEAPKVLEELRKAGVKGLTSAGWLQSLDEMKNAMAR